MWNSRTQSVVLSSAILFQLVGIAPAAERYVGTIQKVGADQIVLKVDKKDHTVAVNSETAITLDGRKAKLTDLKAGHKATVTCKKDGAKLVATKIAAGSKSAAVTPLSLFAALKGEKYRGLIKKIDKKTLYLFQTVKKKTLEFAVNSQTVVTRDGKKSAFADLKTGDTAVVTAETKDGKTVATRIVAKSKTR